jgi:hypothetical protein
MDDQLLHIDLQKKVIALAVALLLFIGVAYAGNATLNSTSSSYSNYTNGTTLNNSIQPIIQQPLRQATTVPQQEIVINIASSQNVRTPTKTSLVSIAIIVIGIIGVVGGTTRQLRKTKRKPNR